MKHVIEGKRLKDAIVSKCPKCQLVQNHPIKSQLMYVECGHCLNRYYVRYK